MFSAHTGLSSWHVNRKLPEGLRSMQAKLGRLKKKFTLLAEMRADRVRDLAREKISNICITGIALRAFLFKVHVRHRFLFRKRKRVASSQSLEHWKEGKKKCTDLHV